MKQRERFVRKIADKTEKANPELADYVDNLRAFADCLEAGFTLPTHWQDKHLGHRISMEGKSA